MNVKQIDRRLFTILMIVFVQMLGASLILPILPLYAQRRFQMRPELITLLVSSFFIAQFLAGPTIGRLSDRYGRLPILIISQIGTAISFLMMAYGQTITILFLSRILDGITGGNIIVAQAYVTDVTPREQRTQSLGYIMAAFGLGFIFGPALGGGLAAFMGEQVPFLIAAIAATLVIFLTWFTLDESLTPEARQANRQKKQSSLSPSQLFQNGPMLLILGIAFVGQFGLGLLQATFALYGEAVLFADRSEQIVNLGIGLLLSVVGVTQFIVQMFLLRRFLHRFGEAILVILGLVSRTVSTFIFSLFAIPLLGGVASVLFALGMGLMMPPLQSLVTNTVDDDVRGGVLGLFQSVVSLAIIAGTSIGGVLFALSPVTPYWVATAVTAVALLPAFFLLRQSRAGKLAQKPAPTPIASD